MSRPDMLPHLDALAAHPLLPRVSREALVLIRAWAEGGPDRRAKARTLASRPAEEIGFNESIARVYCAVWYAALAADGVPDAMESSIRHLKAVTS